MKGYEDLRGLFDEGGQAGMQIYKEASRQGKIHGECLFDTRGALYTKSLFHCSCRLL